MREEAIDPQTLEAADGVCISSTTRDILPVLSIDRRLLPQAPEILNRLLDAFRGFRAAYVFEHSRKKETFAV